MSDKFEVSSATTQQELAEMVSGFKDGQVNDAMVYVDASSKTEVLLPDGTVLTKPLILGDDLLFVQPDGRIVGLLDGAKGDFLLTSDKLSIPSQNIISVALDPGDWQTIADAIELSLFAFADSATGRAGGSGAQEPVDIGDPLDGIGISPLLPPTDFAFPEFRERDAGVDGIGPSDVDIEVTAELRLIETDGALGFQFADFVDITAGNASDGEEITEISITIPNLPLGTVASNGAFASNGTTQTFTFTGTPEEFAALSLTFPTDFSTESRVDGPPGDLDVTLVASSNFGGGSTLNFPIAVEPEGDLGFVGPGVLTAIETDGPVIVRLADGLTPVATDADGSESVDQVDLVLTGFPQGSRISTDGGLTFTPVTGPFAFTGTLAEYEQLQLELPADFSNSNIGATITGELSATTDEGASGAQSFDLVVQSTPDIVVEAPAVAAFEDGDGIDGAGVTVDLGLNVFVDDIDGSEVGTVVSIAFTDLPDGVVFSTGSFTAGTAVWEGTPAEANALTAKFPGDYSGEVTSVITATNNEGSVTSSQSISIAPTGDVDIAVTELLAAETDASIVVTPSANWVVSISDNDPALPAEVLETVTLVLSNLPAGVVAQNVPTATVTYDPATGGNFSFTGTAAEYAALSLTFPTDYSTESVNGTALPGGVLTGTIAATSNEGSNGPTPVSLRITPEGDVGIDVIGTADLQETDAPVAFLPSDYLAPQATDADGSETVTEVQVTFDTLPAGTEFSTDGVTFINAPATLNFTGTLAQYDALIIRLPADFSTQAPGSTLTGTVTALTNEGGSASDDFEVTVAPEGDITLSGPRALTLSENDAPGVSDSDATSQAPVQFLLADALTAAASDADGSDTIVLIEVAMTGLPAGSQISFNNGGVYAAINGGTFPLSVTSIGAYEQIVVRLPDDFSTDSPASTISGTVTFTTDEAQQNGETIVTPDGGVAADTFFVTVSEEGDVSITGSEPTVIEDFGAPIDLGLAVAITDVDGSETIEGDISVAFTGLSADGSTFLSDGTELSSTANTWTGDATGLSALQITSLAEHFSGIITVTPTVVTNETGAAGQSTSFLVSVTPVAEPVITLSVDGSETPVEEVSADNFVVKEDASFLLQINAATPDQDGSETLREVTIENVPAGWLRAGDGPVSIALFEQGASDIDSATINGTTLTVVLNPGAFTFDAALRVTPASNDDRDVETLLGSDLLATVTSVDTAAGLADNTATAQDTVDVDVDAVVDRLILVNRDVVTDESFVTRGFADAGFRRLELTDLDGSESLDTVTFTLTVETESDIYDPATDGDLRLDFRGRQSFVEVTQIDTVPSDTSVAFIIARAATATNAEFEEAITNLRLNFPGDFSGVATLDGTVNWSETRTGDVENDTSDNFASQDFQTVVTVRPTVDAELKAGVFVTNGDFVGSGRTQSVLAEALAQEVDVSEAAQETLTLLESTADGSGPGQVQAFLHLEGTTPDKDGSEELDMLVVSNLPSSWIGVTETTSNVVLDASYFFALDGSGPISAAEFAKIESASYDATTGELTITFEPDVRDFKASVAVYPAVYEDYDVDRANGDPFAADGSFFGGDLNFKLTVQDNNTITTVSRSADVTVDVDVDPVNNFGQVIAFQIGSEQDVDAAGGVLPFAFTPFIDDMDGSETIISTVLRGIPSGITVYVPDLSNPTGPKVPALLTSLNGDGTNDWSLENDQWLAVELRGVPQHFAGKIPIEVDIVTREADGGGTGSTKLSNVEIIVTPAADGGNPSETVSAREDIAVLVQLDGNIIDNAGNSPGSPEVIVEPYVITNVSADAQGRMPRFFDGAPNQIGVDGAGDPTYSNEILPEPGAPGTYSVTPAQATTLHVLTGKDSSETVTFDVTAVYEEQIDPLDPLDPPNPLATTTNTGTVTVNIKGIADTPIVEVQQADPDATPGGIDAALINAVYQPTGTTDGITNSDLVYAYAGYDDTVFQLTQRLSDTALQNGFAGIADPFTAADPLSGERTEITFAGGAPDGSETIYYIITDIPAGISFSGGTPIDPSGGSYLVSDAQLSNLVTRPSGVSEPTYYNMTFNAIVLEADAETSSIPSIGPSVTIQDVLDAIDALPGGSVQSEDFALLVLPSGNVGPPVDCPPDDPRMLPMPELRLVGTGEEDTASLFTIELVPSGPWTSINDLVTLPLGVTGDFGLGLTIPPGATLSGQPSSAVLFDPVTGQYVIDFAQISSAGTETSGGIIYTPPPHQSSPSNPFDPSETFGSADPYDALANIEFTTLLNNYTCNEFTTGAGQFVTVINPVVDGPTIEIGGPASILEDSAFVANIQISSEDGGERQTGDIVITLGGDPGAQLFGTSGLIAPDGGSGTQYTLTPAEIAGLEVRPTPNYSGPLTMTVSATSEEIDNTTLTNTVRRTIDVVPVADTPVFQFNPDSTPTETGLPLVTNPLDPVPIVTIVEDKPQLLSSIILPGVGPDTDGSEAVSAVIGPLPDYVVLSGNVIDNGDGTFTVSEANFATVTIGLADEHARTPDSLDPSILAEVPINISVNSLELENADQATGSSQFLLRVLPDADKPTVTADISPTGGVEDDGTIYTLDLEGTTPDPHETLSFEVTVPQGSAVFIDGVSQTVPVNGIVTIPGVLSAPADANGATYVPTGVVTFVPAPDFSGTAGLSVIAVSSDTSALYSYTDTEGSDAASLDLAITPTPDLSISVTDLVLDAPETDAPVTVMPSSNVALNISDGDGSETVDTVTFTLTGVPAGTTYSTGGVPVAVSGTLSFTGSATEFAALAITFPTDFSTNGTPLAATVRATTNEGGDVTENYELTLSGEIDLALTTAPVDVLLVESSAFAVPLGINAVVTDIQTTPSETLEEAAIQFDAPLAIGIAPSDGVLSADRQSLTLTRGAIAPADFALMVAALSLTVPAAFADPIAGTVTATTNHGTSGPVALDVNINTPPEVTGTVDVPQTFETSLVVSFSDLTANAVDADTPLIVENLTSPDPNVGIQVLGEDVTITVPAGYVGTPILEYDVVDSSGAPARTANVAELDFDTLQMQDSGTTSIGTDGTTRAILSDVTGDASLGGTVAKGTDGDDGVIWDAADRPYDGITEFELMGGSDFVDLRGATSGFTVNLGDGEDIVIGSGYSDVLNGGADDDVLEGGVGLDTLTGGGGADDFVLSSGPIDIADVITDFGAGDQVDLSQVINGVNDITGLASYDAATGELDVGGVTAFNIAAAGGGMPAQVEVIFEDSAGAAQTAVL
ncbi:hypothetical protein [Roseobacter sp.]|uniref:hypothetical protein n=1 Tax=Roseobacter sp. TaxID=1907202 RepID=UPI003858C0BF